MRRVILLIGILLWSGVSGALAESDLHCEVVRVEGPVFVIAANEELYPVSEGDLLKEGDWLEIQEGGLVDIAYDPKWENVTRITQVSKIQIHSLDTTQTNVFLEYGDVYAKLDSLPKDSTFEVETPVAVAAVRGSAFHTNHRNNISNISNLGHSPVSVLGKTTEGNRNYNSLKTIQNNQQTQVLKLGSLPTPAVPVPKPGIRPPDTNYQPKKDVLDQNKDRLSETKLTDPTKINQLSPFKTKLFGPHAGPHVDGHQLNHFGFHDFPPPHTGPHDFDHFDTTGPHNVFHVGPHQQPHVDQHGLKDPPHVGPHDQPHDGPHD